MSNININLFIIFYSFIGIFFIKSQELKILSPKDLKYRFPNSIPVSLSNFGRIPYGNKLIGRLYYDPINTDQQTGCDNITNINLEYTDEARIVMLKRGPCWFTNKVYNVQDLGGNLALIVYNETVSDIRNIIMSDPYGIGKDLGIAGLLISKEDGQVFHDYFLEHYNNTDIINNIRLEIDFEFTKRDIVSYELYYHSDNNIIYDLLEKLNDMNNILSNKVNFVTRYSTIMHPSFNYSKISDNICLANGRYCPISYNFDFKSNDYYDGIEYVTNHVFERCVQMYTNSHNRTQFLDYIEEMNKVCIKKTHILEIKNFSFKNLTDCTRQIMNDTGIPLREIDECYKSSFVPRLNAIYDEIDMNYKNTILEEDRMKRTSHFINLLPALVINDRMYYGSLNPDNIFEAICSAFTRKPEECFKRGYFIREEYLDDDYYGLIILIIIIVILNLLVFIICRRYFKKKMSEKLEGKLLDEKINDVVSNYLALRDQK